MLNGTPPEMMEYLQYKFTGINPEGQTCGCTMFFEHPGAPAEPEAIEYARRMHPGVTGIVVASATMITAERYAVLVREMCDSDTWGFQVVG